MRPGIPLVEGIMAFVAVVVMAIITAVVSVVVGLFVMLYHFLTGRRRSKRRTAVRQTEHATEQEPVATATETPIQTEQVMESGSEEHPSQNNTRTTQTAAQSATVRKASAVQYRGELKWAGFKKRTDVENPYTSYCVRIFDPKVKTQVEVWGKGIKTALETSGAEPGDLIILEQVGQQAVDVDGQAFRKNLWDLKIERKKHHGFSE